MENGIISPQHLPPFPIPNPACWRHGKRQNSMSALSDRPHADVCHVGRQKGIQHGPGGLEAELLMKLIDIC